jgi:hypothetical protein
MPNLPAFFFLNFVYREKHSQADNLRSSWNWKNNKLKIVPENSQTLVCFIRLQKITADHFVSGMNPVWNPELAAIHLDKDVEPYPSVYPSKWSQNRSTSLCGHDRFLSQLSNSLLSNRHNI